MTRRYLLVDDNVAFGENLAEILGDLGAEVTLASGGPAALEVARARGPFDGLITDMRMPVMSGARLVHEIRAIDPGLPALVVTAYTGEADLLAARREGLLGVLPKPVPVDRLLALLACARRDGLVAIVEDDFALADNLCELLRDDGFSAVTAASVVDADRFAGVRPFAALADMRLPGAPDGAAVTKLTQTFPGLPVLVMTAFHDSVTRALAGVESDTVFYKPFDPARLLASLDRLWRTRRAA